MWRRSGRGFTIVELLVLIAIIGFLAVMLFPVLAARSEQARRLSCMANQQQIVSAVRMYMADNDDTLPPREHRQEVLDYFDSAPGGGGPRIDETGHCWYLTWANPYLRWPVIFDPYLSTRDVWRCPSAVLMSGATWIISRPDWLRYLQEMEGTWGEVDRDAGGPCYYAWPTGWGGSVTDSIVQRRMALPGWPPPRDPGTAGGFIQSIAMPLLAGLTLYEVADPARLIITSDGGAWTQDLGVGAMAYPDICALECGNCAGWADWEECASWAAECGLYSIAPNDGSFLSSVGLRLPYTRHRARFAPGMPGWLRSGVNIGLLDGHVRWIASESLVSDMKDGTFTGVEFWGPPMWCDTPEEWGGYLSGEPTLW